MAKRPRIVVVGSVNTDMVVKGKRLPGPGETVSGGRFLMAGGGKGANQAVAAARLGAEVTLVAKVGRDMLGDQAIENFRREGIRTDCILRDPEQHTGVALILVDDAGENLISVASGANHALTPEEIDAGGRSHPRGRHADAAIGDAAGDGASRGADRGRGGRAGDSQPGPGGAAARRTAAMRYVSDAERDGGRAADGHCRCATKPRPGKRPSDCWPWARGT